MINRGLNFFLTLKLINLSLLYQKLSRNSILSIQLSTRIQKVKPSATIASSIKARALQAQGISVIDLGVGEPDFDTPNTIKEAAIKAIEAGFTKYTPVDGIPTLRQAFVNKLKKDNGLDYEMSQVMVSNGCKQCIYNLAQACLNPSDEVILFAPYWVSYTQMVKLAGATPVIISAGIDENFKITPEKLEQAITDKTRLLLINSPANPTGIAYTKAELQALAQVLIKHPNILIATDDIYEHILWAKEPFHNLIMANSELIERTVILHGVSKTYAMTGWRIGFAAGPKPLIQAMTTLQGQSTSGASSISQKAALAALEGDQTCVAEMVAAFKERHDYLVSALNQLPGFRCIPSDGTFYSFPNVEGVIDHLQRKGKPISNDAELADYLLNEAHVVTVPGSGFGAPGYLRFSFATNLDNLHEAIKRIKNVL